METEEYYIYLANDSIGELLEKMLGCERIMLNTYCIKTSERVVEALKGLNYISSYERVGRIKIPGNEEFRILDV